MSQFLENGAKEKTWQNKKTLIVKLLSGHLNPYAWKLRTIFTYIFSSQYPTNDSLASEYWMPFLCLSLMFVVF